MILRKANSLDSKEIANLQKQAFPSEDNSFIDVQIKSDNFRVFVASNQNILGFATFQVVIDEADLFFFAISQDEKNKGVGTRLFEYAIESLISEGIKKITLEVRKSNLFAQKIYEKFNFKLISVRKEYYNYPKEDGLVYLWEEGN